MDNNSFAVSQLNNEAFAGTPGPAGPPGPPGPPGPGSLPMTPLVEGIAFGETSVGRTLLGFQVDDSSNNVGLWCSSVGLPQGVSNSSSSVTAFFDTDVAGSQLQNGVYVGQAGSMTSTNASNSIILTRASTMDGSADLTQNTLIANMLTLDPSDMITRSVALIGGEFVTHPSTFDQSILIGDVERTGGLANDVILIRTQGGGGTLTMANNSGYIGNGANTYVSAAGDFRVADYQAFHLNTLRPDATPANVVYYEPADGELTYGALPAAPVDMTPTVSGLAFGSQDQTKELNSLGAGVSIDPSVNRATARYNAVSVGTPQAALYSNCIFDDNRSTQTAGTSTSDAITMVNGGDISDSQFVSSITEANNANTSVTSVGDSIFEANLGSIKSAQVLNSIVVANRSTLDSSTFDRSCLQVSGLAAPGIGYEGATMLGSLTPVNVTSMRESMFLASNAGVPVDQQGRQSLYCGNLSQNETINDREAWFSSYDRFFLRTLRNDPSPPDICYYDPGTAELTYGAPPVPALAAKQPNTLGGQYGISSLGNASDVNGRNSFVNYAAGPPQLSGVSSVGSSQFQVNNPGLSSFVNSIFLGRTHSFNAVQSVTDTLLAANIVTGANISQITTSNIIVPKAGSLTFTYAGAVTGANIVSSGAVICVSDPLYSTVLASGGSVTPAGSNLVLATNQGAGSISMNGSGNSLVLSAGNSVVYNWPVGVSNSCALQNGASVVTPSASNQLCSNHLSLRMPNINAAGVADINTLPMAFSSTTGLISPTLSSLLSRVYRAVGTTTAAGQVTFTPGGSVNPSTVGYSFQATVRNASTTVAYTCSINAVTATSVTVQAFQSTTVVLASPSMVPAGAGIIVHFSMAY